MSSTGDSLTALVSAIPFCAHIGLTPAANDTIALPDAGSVLNHVGTVHAGALFTLGEAASGVAVMRDVMAGTAASVLVAKSATIAYKKPARGRITARGALREAPDAILARLKGDGKATFEVEVTMTDAEGVEVASMNVEWYARA